MDILIKIPDEEFEKVKALLSVRKGLEKSYESLKSNSLVQAINSVNIEINTILLNGIYENKDWQK